MNISTGSACLHRDGERQSANDSERHWLELNYKVVNKISSTWRHTAKDSSTLASY